MLPISVVVVLVKKAWVAPVELVELVAPVELTLILKPLAPLVVVLGTRMPIMVLELAHKVVVEEEEEEEEVLKEKAANPEKRAANPEKVKSVVANLEKEERVANADVK